MTIEVTNTAARVHILTSCVFVWIYCFGNVFVKLTRYPMTEQATMWQRVKITGFLNPNVVSKALFRSKTLIFVVYQRRHMITVTTFLPDNPCRASQLFPKYLLLMTSNQTQRKGLKEEEECRKEQPASTIFTPVHSLS